VGCNRGNPDSTRTLRCPLDCM